MSRVTKLTIFFIATLLQCGAMGTLRAQDCDGFGATKVGTMIETTNYDGQHKVMNKVQAKTVSNTTVDGQQKIVVNQCVLGTNGECGSASDIAYICKDGDLQMDLKTTPTGLENLLGVNPKAVLHYESEDLTLPKTLEVGMKLPDGFFRMTSVVGKYAKMDVAIEYTKRKVVDRESITTPGGDFDCYVVEQEQHMVVITPKTKEYKIGEDRYIDIVGRKSIASTMHVMTWYAVGVGAVRSETSMNGKVMYTSEITKVSGN